WEESYELLCKYREVNGHCNVLQSEKPLGPWVNRQRIEHARYINPDSDKPTAMNCQRKKLLDGIGFVWDGMEHTWNTRYMELCEFRKVNGHCVVPRSYGRLGAWVEKQRIEYKKYKAAYEDRIVALEKLGFVWDVHQWQWNQTYHELLEYRRIHNDTNVPMSRGALGLWVFNQRAHYNNFRKGKQSHMTEDRL
ncbi:predicted protein, partial [Thalassiosira pseudonana CCMP1335]